MTIIKTRFGDLDAEGLKTMRRSFNAMDILHAVEKVEMLRREMETVRDGLLRLHRITQCVMTEEEVVERPLDEPSEVVWRLAEELATAMQDWPDEIGAVRHMLAEMEQLEPCHDAAENAVTADSFERRA